MGGGKEEEKSLSVVRPERALATYVRRTGTNNVTNHVRIQITSQLPAIPIQISET